MTHDQANQAFADRLFNLCAGKSAVDAVRQPEVHLLLGQADSELGQATQPYEQRNCCTPACGFTGCSRIRVQRNGNQTVGEAEGAGFRAGEGPIA